MKLNLMPVMSEPEDTPSLPDLHQSEIKEDMLKQLFIDIGTHTRTIEIIPKRAPGFVGSETKHLEPDQAFNQLISRELRGLQIRYQHQGKTWWDTIMPLPSELFRIVRIQHDF